jgi:hypothetical protein
MGSSLIEKRSVSSFNDEANEDSQLRHFRMRGCQNDLS